MRCVHHKEERKKHRCEKLERKKERGKKRKKEKRKLWREISRSEEERKQRQKKERDVGWCQELSVTLQCNGFHNFPLFNKLPVNSYRKHQKCVLMDKICTGGSIIF